MGSLNTLIMPMGWVLITLPTPMGWVLITLPMPMGWGGYHFTHAQGVEWSSLCPCPGGGVIITLMDLDQSMHQFWHCSLCKIYRRVAR